MLRLVLGMALGIMLGFMLGFRSPKTPRTPINKGILSFGC